MPFANQDRESAKQRALRIPLDYVHRRDAVQWSKLVGCVIAGLLTAAYCGWLIWSNNGPIAFSHGPVTNVHAIWDSNCSACHIDFIAIRDDAANPLHRLGLVHVSGTFPGSRSPHQLVEQKCQTCHRGAAHHGNELPGDAESCTSCHTDHRGRHADIARPSDIHCTRCHQDIAVHRSKEPSVLGSPSENVSAFAPKSQEANEKLHPDFRSLASDPGNVKFNHALHLTEGIRARDVLGQQGRKLMSLADLPEKYVEQYRMVDQTRGHKDDREYPIQLNCSSCHQLDNAKTSPSSPIPVAARIPSGGAYMLPVQYEMHCQACHPLRFAEPDGEITHAMSPAAMREFLFGRYLYKPRSKQLNEAANELVPRRVIPGRVANESEASVDEPDVGRRVAAAAQQLRVICAKCHNETPNPHDAKEIPLPDVEDANIPHVWLKHARFDHSAHRAMQCVECHAKAYDENSMSAVGLKDQDVVMIAGRDVCLKCHSPTPAVNSSGARSDCVECHRYHSAGQYQINSLRNPRTGNPSVPLSIENFLRATNPTQASSP